MEEEPPPPPLSQQDRPVIKTINKPRRYRSLPTGYESSPTTQITPFTHVSAEAFHKEAWETLLERLKVHDVNTDVFNEKEFSWCLPTSLLNQGSWFQLFIEPILLPNDALKRLIRLEESTARSDMPKKDETCFYVRTYPMTKRQLLEVLSSVFDDQESPAVPSKVWAWLLTMSDMQDNEYLYIRYIGKTEVRRPWDRFQQDLIGTGGGIALRFLWALQELFPAVIQQVEIHEVSRAHLHVPMLAEEVNKPEQMLIALFLEGCLNLEIGGARGRQWTPGFDDETRFAALQTNTRQQLATTVPCSAQTQAAVEAYARDVIQYAQSHPLKTGTNRYPMGPDQERAILQQAIPTVVTSTDFTPLVMLGLEVPRGGHDTVPWFTSGHGMTMTERVVTDTFQQLCTWEAGFGRTAEVGLIRFLADNHKFPFANVFPWHKKEFTNLPETLPLLRQYFRAVDPLVVGALGNEVTKIAQAAFHPCTRPDHESFLATTAGTPILTSYKHADDDPDLDASVLVIALPHPGSIGYGYANNEHYSRFLLMCFEVLWLATGLAIRLGGSGQPKGQICRAIYEAVVAGTGPETQFGRSFAQVKRAMQQARPARSPQSSRQPVVHPTSRDLATAPPPSGQRTPSPTKVDLPPPGPSAADTTSIPSRSENPSLRERMAEVAERRNASWLEAHQASHTEDAVGFATMVYTEGGPLIIQHDRRRWNLAFEELNVLIIYSQASGRQKSGQRQVQARSLYAQPALVEIHSCFPEEDGFVNFMNTRAAKDKVLLAIASLEEKKSLIPNLLSVFLTNVANPNANTWLNDDSLVSAALGRLQAWLNKLMAPDKGTQFHLNYAVEQWHKLMKDQNKPLYNALNLHLESKKDFTMVGWNDDNELVEVSVNPQYHMVVMHLAWKDAAGNPHSLDDFYVPQACLPTTPNDVRFLHFVPQGLNIQDQKGLPFSVAGTDKLCTIPISQLLKTLKGKRYEQAFISLWEHRTGKSMDAQLDDLARIQGLAVGLHPNLQAEGRILASYFDGRSTSLDAQVRIIEHTEKALQALFPVQPGDGLWLLDVV